MDLAKIIFLWFVMLGLTSYASINFSSTPGLMRHKERDDVTFTWILDRKPERLIEIAVWYNSSTIIKQIADGTVTTDTKYEGRVSMTVTDKTTEMTLSNVNQNDVIYGVYKITCNVVIDGSVMTLSDTSAELYLFGKPTKPVISGIKDIKEGNDITLSCMASPTSVPTKYQLPLRYTWTRDDNNLTQALPSRHTINGHQLMISDVMRDDRNHHYTCIAGEDGGLSSESDDVLLRILYPPGEARAAVSEIGPLIEGENTNTDITCSVSDPGYPQAIFKWSKDNQDQSGGEHGTISIRQGTATVSKHDGTWKCTPSNSVGDGSSAVISVRVNAKASLSPPLPSTLTAVADPRVSFNVTCGFISKPAAIISWTYNNGQLPTSVITQPMTTTASGKKSIITQKLLWNPDSDAPSRRSAGGQYLCKGIVDLGTGRIDTKQSQMILNVEYGPYEIEFNDTDTITAVAGVDQITLACNSDCKPSCSYQWKKRGGSLVTRGRILDLHPVQKVDHGSYVCVASNKHATGGLSKQFTLNVNFAPEITSFVPSTSSDIIQNNTLNITCEVSSRPKSTIAITNINTSNIILSVSDSHKAVYTFDRVHVLDSGVYQCSASNGIKSLINVTKQMILDVKGGYNFCETPRTEEGKALYTNMTISVCITANPFTQITKDNWTFKPNTQQMVQSLPDDVSTSVEDTSHLYKKYVKLHTDKITQAHYGTYMLELSNIYSIHKLKYTFNLLPEGPPVPPHDIKITYITAVSIYLEWMAGFDGGPDQTFWLYVFDRDTSDWFIISNITDTSAGQGGLIEYKLTQEQGVVPGQTYNIHVGAINSISNVTGPAVLVHTKPLPIFKSSTPDITYRNNRAEITWSINNLDSVTNMLIEVCVSDGSLCKPAINVTSPEIQPYVIPLPEGATGKYTFNFTLYDGVDVVNRVETTDGPVKRLPVAAIVGSIVAILMIVVVIILIILWKRGVIAKDTADQRSTDRERSREVYGYNNPVIELEDDDELTPYGTTTAVSTNITAVPESNAESVKKGKVGPLTGDIYATVSKPKSNRPAEKNQLESNDFEETKMESGNKPSIMPKPTKQASKKKDRVYQSRPVSVYPPETTESLQQDNVPMYAQVNKGRKSENNHAKGRPNQNIKLAGPLKNNKKAKEPRYNMPGVKVHGETGKQYVNVLGKESQDGAYSEVEIPQMAVRRDIIVNENQYADGGNIKESKLQMVGEDGITYADLDIIDKPPADPDVIHGIENLVEYASIDFSKLNK